jgi:hypothetical protein
MLFDPFNSLSRRYDDKQSTSIQLKLKALVIMLNGFPCNLLDYENSIINHHGKEGPSVEKEGGEIKRTYKGQERLGGVQTDHS